MSNLVVQILGGAAVVAVSAFLVYLKLIRPIQGDVAYARQGERIEAAKARRLGRRHAKAEHSV